jgi:TldD protein
MLNNPVTSVCQHLLTPAGLDENAIVQTMDKLQHKHIDIADIYCQHLHREIWSLEDGIVKEGSHQIQQGIGVRAISGEKTGFACTNEFSLSALTKAANTARNISVHNQKSIQHQISQQTTPAYYEAQSPLQLSNEQSRLKLMHLVDTAARAYDEKVTQVNVDLAAAYEHILICDENYRFSADIRPLVRLNVTVIVEHQGKREQGSSGGGARSTLEFLSEQNRAINYAEEAVRQALINLEAQEAPAGTLPVVLASGWPGVLLHEAVGHGLEGDFNRKGTSTFSGALGQQVASTACTVVDNGTLNQRRGSLNIDDEGNQTQETILIENGILRQYLQDRMNARLMKLPITGNGRRESYAYLPMPRMTNTYLKSGEQTPEDIIKSVKKGLYAVNFSGGQVDITSGKFVFSTSEAYLIENGKITAPVKGATLIGDGPEVMQKISQVGNDLALDSGVGTCGKEGQSVPVGVGQPTLKIDELTIGGTQLK